jgi:enoyl-CoA hydratase
VSAPAPARETPYTRSWQTMAVERTGDGDLDVILGGTGEGNVLGGLFWTELGELTELVRRWTEPGCVVLRGRGDVFSRGLDLRWYVTRLRRAQRRGDLAEAVLADVGWLQGVITGLASCPRAVVAVVDGECT